MRRPRARRHAIILAATLPLLGAARAASAQACSAGGFEAERRFAAGSGPAAVAVADFNGDGRADLAVADSGPGRVSILLGDGAGGFGAPASFVVGSAPLAVVVADFNGDGKPDLAVANSGSNTVSVLLGNGSGGFGAATSFGVGTGPRSIAAGDFNGDGKPDLVTANATSNDVSVLLGTGSGSFGPAASVSLGSVPFGAKNPVSVAVGDLNGDGRADIATANSNPKDFGISILLGSGTGSFGSPTVYGAAGSSDAAVAVADLNGDTLADLVVVQNDPTVLWSTATVYLGDGTGAFGIGTRFDIGANHVRSVALGDLNRDGRLDLVGATSPQASSAGTVAVLLGDGAGGFGAATHLGADLGTRSAAIADLDGDGMADVVAANSGSSDASVFIRTTTPSCALSISNAVALEGDAGTTDAVFIVTLFPANSQTVSVSYATSDLTAIAGSDYLPTSGTLTLAPGTTTATIPVPVIGDARAEPSEYFAVTLFSATNATVATGLGVGTISADDFSNLTVGDVTVPEGDAGTTSAFFTVTLTKPSDLTVSVDYATSDVTAAAGVDYGATSGTLTFPPGVVSQAVSVPVFGNTAAGPDRTFLLLLSGSVNGAIARDRAVGTIVDDDGFPSTYTIADVGVLPGAAASAAYGLNGSGQVVGRASGGTLLQGHAFLWQPGRMTDLGTLPGGVTSTAYAIDALGKVAGASDDSTGFEHGVTWDAGTVKDLGTLPDQLVSRVFALGKADRLAVLAGEVQTASGLHAATWQAGANFTDLGALPDGLTSTARDINAAGQVVGWSTTTSSPTGPVHAFLWQPGSIADLGTLGGSDSYARAINDSGVVVGRSQPPSSLLFHAFRWQSGSPMADLGTLPAAPESEARDVNRSGDVVGTSGGRAVLWPAGGAIQDLNALLPAGSGWTLTSANAINDRGQIAGEGTIGGQTHGFRISPPAELLSIGDASVAEGQAGWHDAVFTVTLSPPSSRTVTVDYATADVTATAGSDYQATSGTLTFAPGVTTETLSVPVRGDTEVEPDETFAVNLSNPGLASILDGQGIGTILDSGPPVVIESFTIAPFVAGGPGTATLTWSTTGAVSVAIGGVTGSLPASGTATAGFSQTTTYTLTASGASGGMATAQATVTVLPAPGQNLAAPAIVAPSEGQQIGVSAVTVSWGAVAGAAGYGIKVLGTTNGATLFSGSLSGGGATSTVLSLPDGSYAVLVRACGAGGDLDSACGAYGMAGFTVSLPAPGAAPTIATPPTGASLTASTTTLSWTAVAGATSYEVLLRRLTDDSTALRITVFPPDQSTIFSLGSGRYRLTVRACLAACGPASTPSDFTVTLPEVPFAAPQLTSVSLSGTDLTLAWTAVANADLYRIQVVQPSSGPGGGALSVAARQVSETSVTLPVPQGQASILVAACNGDGCGPFGAPFPIDPAAGNPPLPNLGTPMKGTVVAGPVVNFSWNRVPGDDGSNTFYRLYVADLSRQTTALDVYTTDNFWAAYFKAEGARYDAQVIANPGCVSAGPGCTAAEAAGPASGFNVAGTSAVAPTLDTPGHQSSLTQGNLTLGWTPVAGATLYQYYVSGGGQNPAVTGVTTGLFVQVPLFAVDGLPTRYVGIVRACPAGATCAAGSDAGWGPWSDVGGPGVTSFTVTP